MLLDTDLRPGVCSQSGFSKGNLVSRVVLNLWHNCQEDFGILKT